MSAELVVDDEQHASLAGSGHALASNEQPLIGSPQSRSLADFNDERFRDDDGDDDDDDGAGANDRSGISSANELSVHDLHCTPRRTTLPPMLDGDDDGDQSSNENASSTGASTTATTAASTTATVATATTTTTTTTTTTATTTTTTSVTTTTTTTTTTTATTATTTATTKLSSPTLDAVAAAASGEHHASSASAPATSVPTAATPPTTTSSTTTPAAHSTSLATTADVPTTATPSATPAKKKKFGYQETDATRRVAEMNEHERRKEAASASMSTSSTTGTERLDPVVVKRRKHAKEESHDAAWQRHKRHYFVLDDSGKPIYARFGDEVKLAGFMGVLQVLLSLFEDSRDTLHSVHAGSHCFAFLQVASIYLVAVSAHNEPPALLRRELAYVHSQIVAMLSNTVIDAIARRRRESLRDSLAGAEKFLDSLVYHMPRDASFLLRAVSCLRLAPQTRAQIASVIVSARVDTSMMYALLIAGRRVVTVVRPKRQTIEAGDIHLLLNFVTSSTSLRESEGWTPVCMPYLDGSGFVQLYSSFLADDVCLLLISTSTDADAFFALRQTRLSIVKSLNASGALGAVVDALRRPVYSVADTGVPQLLHFIYKSVAQNQFSAPRFTAPYNTRREQKRLMKAYRDLHSVVHGGATSSRLRCFHFVGQHESVLCLTTKTMELYVVLSPLEPKSTALRVANQLMEWVKREETSLFMLDLPTFAS